MQLIKKVFSSPEWNFIDIIKFFKGEALAAKFDFGLWDFNLIEQIPAVKIPVYFFAGRMDYQTSQYLAEKYYNLIKAPKKEFYWFEKSAHCPNFSETEKFNELVIKCFKSDT